MTINRLNLLWGTTPIRCPKVNSTEALVDVAESLLEQYGYVRPREVIAIVAGTRTKSGSTNFLRLHVLGEHNQEGVRFFAPTRGTRQLPSPEPAKQTRNTAAKHRSPKPSEDLYTPQVGVRANAKRQKRHSNWSGVFDGSRSIYVAISPPTVAARTAGSRRVRSTRSPAVYRCVTLCVELLHRPSALVALTTSVRPGQTSP